MLLWSAVVAVAPGCSSKYDYGETGHITGRLTLDGKPMAPGHGVVFMEPIKGFLAYGETDSNGNFEVNSWNNGAMPVGPYRVQIGPPASPPPRAEMTSEERFENPDEYEPVAPAREFPQKYLNFDSSELRFEIKSGENHFEIDLKKE
jgi:hypothetical protein